MRVTPNTAKASLVRKADSISSNDFGMDSHGLTRRTYCILHLRMAFPPIM
jgi:hypothetical protein